MEPKDWIAGLSLLLSVIVSVLAWFRASRDEVKKLGTEITALEGDIKAIRAEIDHLPTSEQFQGLQLAMTAMKGQSDVFAEQLKTIRESQQRIERWIMEPQTRTKLK